MDDWDTEQAVTDAINGALIGEVTPLTPESLSYPEDEFDGHTELELRHLIRRLFSPAQEMNFTSDIICVGEALIQSEETTVYLLAQNTQTRGIVYLISPSPILPY